MKQYLDKQQTSKLIELGFEKPCSIASVEPIYGMGGISVAKAYTIGELLSILPSTVGKDYDLHIEFSVTKWYVAYYWIGNGEEYFIKYQISACELIDALFDMIVKLNEEGMI